jgi:hypothetical protein
MTAVDLDRPLSASDMEEVVRRSVRTLKWDVVNASVVPEAGEGPVAAGPPQAAERARAAAKARSEGSMRRVTGQMVDPRQGADKDLAPSPAPPAVIAAA